MKDNIVWYGRMMATVTSLDSDGSDGEVLPAVISVLSTIYIINLVLTYCVQLNSVNGITKFAVGVSRTTAASFINYNTQNFLIQFRHIPSKHLFHWLQILLLHAQTLSQKVSSHFNIHNIFSRVAEITLMCLMFSHNSSLGMKPVNISAVNLREMDASYDPLTDLYAAAQSSIAEVNEADFTELIDLPATITFSPCSYQTFFMNECLHLSFL